MLASRENRVYPFKVDLWDVSGWNDHPDETEGYID